MDQSQVIWKTERKGLSAPSFSMGRQMSQSHIPRRPLERLLRHANRNTFAVVPHGRGAFLFKQMSVFIWFPCSKRYPPAPSVQGRVIGRTAGSPPIETACAPFLVLGITWTFFGRDIILKKRKSVPERVDFSPERFDGKRGFHKTFKPSENHCPILLPESG